MSYYFPFPSLSVNHPHFRRTRCSAPETTPPGTSFHLCYWEGTSILHRRGRKRKWRCLAHSARHGTKNLLNGGVPLRRNVLTHLGGKLTGTVSQWRYKERIRRGLSHSARQGTNTLWNGGGPLRKSVLTHRKENVQARKWEEN
jgi:hypothetical protein